MTGLPSATIAFDQFFLASDQVEAGAIAHVIQSPCLARGLLVAADRQHDDIRLLRHAHGFGNLPCGPLPDRWATTSS